MKKYILHIINLLFILGCLSLGYKVGKQDHILLAYFRGCVDRTFQLKGGLSEKDMGNMHYDCSNSSAKFERENR